MREEIVAGVVCRRPGAKFYIRGSMHLFDSRVNVNRKIVGCVDSTLPPLQRRALAMAGEVHGRCEERRRIQDHACAD